MSMFVPAVLWLIGAASPVTAAPDDENRAIRDLVCRGKPGIDLRISSKPSPADSRMVRMVLRFAPATQPAGANFEGLAPGTCTWNPNKFPNVPPEAGVVYFDVAPEAQPWSETRTRQMDTTVNAAIFFQDTISLPRYLSSANNYWRFYVDDATNFSNSFGAIKHTAQQPTYVTLTGPFGNTTPTVAELRCRGGGSTLFFGRGGSAGNNQLNMSLTYRLAGAEAGPSARGLTAGTCAWVKRANMAREPGRIDFVTAANAQLVQARTGGTIDRSPRAAERFPDANTIPEYMKDPAHYWNFHIAVAQPTTARSHAYWKPVAGVGERTAGTPTERSRPQTTGNRERTAGTGTTMAIADPGLIFREVVRKPTEYWLRFSARANSSPTVEYSTEAPVRSGGRLTFRSPARMIVRQGEVTNFSADYSTAPVRNLPRNTKYYFVINVPAGSQSQRPREYSGEFTTFSQRVEVRFTRIHVLNDSDKTSDGSLSFIFNLTPAPHVSVECGRGDDCSKNLFRQKWGTGSSNPIEITLSMASSPDRVRVWVNGEDEDGGFGDTPRIRDNLYGSGGGSRRMSDYNTASGEFNVGQFPDRPVIRFPFKLRSVDGSVFMFEVHGEIEVTRR